MWIWFIITASISASCGYLLGALLGSGKIADLEDENTYLRSLFRDRVLRGWPTYRTASR